MEGAAREDPAVRGDGDDVEQVTPQVVPDSVPAAPGAPVKKNRRSSAIGNLKPKKLVYRDGVDEQENELTQESSESFHFSQAMQVLLETRINTTEGTWVQCGHPSCGKWRYLAEIIDPSELPEKWYCSMNKDLKHNNCEAEEEDQPDELLEAKYFVGSIVWARVQTYPWWPAMIDDDPDLGLYEWREGQGLPTHYHVTFLDKNVTRAWVLDSKCMAFRVAHNHDGPAKNKVPANFRQAFDAAVETAELALKLPVAERIKKYCFRNRYPGICKSLPKASKGTKRRRERSSIHDNSKEEEPAHSRAQQPRASPKQVKSSRGKPRKEKSGTNLVPSQASQGVKRPRGRPRKNANADANQPACPTTKQPKVSSKQDPKSTNGVTAQVACKKTLSKQAAPLKKAKRPHINDMLPEFVYVPSVNEPQGAEKTLKTTATVTLPPPTATMASTSADDTVQDANKIGQMQAESQTKDNKNVAEMFSDSKKKDKARGNSKKAPLKPVANVKQVLQPNAEATESTFVKPSTKRATFAQKKYKVATTITSSLSTATMASSSTEDSIQELDKTASQMQGDHQSEGDDNSTGPSEKSLFQHSADHEGTSSEAAMMAAEPKKPENLFETPQPTTAENKWKNLLPNEPAHATKDGSVESSMTSDVVQMLPDNTATNHPIDADMTCANTQGVGPVMPDTDNHSSNGEVEKPADAKQSLSTPIFDDVATQPECFPNLNLVLEFLDSDVTTPYKPILNSLNRAAEAICTNNPPAGLLLSSKVIGLESSPIKPSTAPENVPNGASMHSDNAQGHGTAIPSMTTLEIHYESESSSLSGTATAVSTKVEKTLQQSQVMGSETAPKKAPNKKSVQTTGDGLQGHGTTIPSANTTKKPGKVKKPNQAPPVDLNGIASNTCVAPIAQAGMAKGKVPGNDREQAAANKKTSSSLNKQSSKPKKQPASENKENTGRPAKPQAALSTETMLAKPRKTASKPTQLSGTPIATLDVPKKASFKVPVKDRSAAKMEAKLQAALANAVANVANVVGTRKPADSEDSDFDSLSNTQELTFEDVLSSISQGMSQDRESDFVSLEGFDGSQTVNTAE